MFLPSATLTATTTPQADTNRGRKKKRKKEWRGGAEVQVRGVTHGTFEGGGDATNYVRLASFFFFFGDSIRHSCCYRFSPSFLSRSDQILFLWFFFTFCFFFFLCIHTAHLNTRHTHTAGHIRCEGRHEIAAQYGTRHKTNR